MLYNIYLSTIAGTSTTNGNYSVSFGTQNPTKITASITLGDFLFSPKKNAITDIFSWPEIIFTLCMLGILLLALLWFFIPLSAKDYLEKLIDKIVYLTRKKTKKEKLFIKNKKLDKKIKEQREKLQEMEEKQSKYSKKISKNESLIDDNENSNEKILNNQEEHQSIFSNNLIQKQNNNIQDSLSDLKDSKISNDQQSVEIIDKDNLDEFQKKND